MSDFQQRRSSKPISTTKVKAAPHHGNPTNNVPGTTIVNGWVEPEEEEENDDINPRRQMIATTTAERVVIVAASSPTPTYDSSQQHPPPPSTKTSSCVAADHEFDGIQRVLRGGQGLGEEPFVIELSPEDDYDVDEIHDEEEDAEAGTGEQQQQQQQQQPEYSAQQRHVLEMQLRAMRDEREAVLKQLEMWGDRCCQLQDEVALTRKQHAMDKKKWEESSTKQQQQNRQNNRNNNNNNNNNDNNNNQQRRSNAGQVGNYNAQTIARVRAILAAASSGTRRNNNDFNRIYTVAGNRRATPSYQDNMTSSSTQAGDGRSLASWRAEALSRRKVCASLELRLKGTTGHLNILKQELHEIRDNGSRTPSSSSSSGASSSEEDRSTITTTTTTATLQQQQRLEAVLENCRAAKGLLRRLGSLLGKDHPAGSELQELNKLMQANLMPTPSPKENLTHSKTNHEHPVVEKTTTSQSSSIIKSSGDKDKAPSHEELVEMLETRIAGLEASVAADRKEHDRKLWEISQRIDQFLKYASEKLKQTIELEGGRGWLPAVKCSKTWVKTRATELSVTTGERLELLSDDNSEFWLCSRKDRRLTQPDAGCIGYVPKAVLEKLEHKDPLAEVFDEVLDMQKSIESKFLNTEEDQALASTTAVVPLSSSSNSNNAKKDGSSGEDLPEGWERAVDEFGCTYFVNHIDKETTWLHPVTKKPVQPTQVHVSLLSQEGLDGGLKPRVRQKQDQEHHGEHTTQSDGPHLLGPRPSAEELAEVEALLAVLASAGEFP